jgi:nitrate reductase cytochrome c-type subunit
MTMFDMHGPWHSDEGYYCYQCHVSTHEGGVGFCGYCHDDKD